MVTKYDIDENGIDILNTDSSSNLVDTKLLGVVGFIEEQYRLAKDSRRMTESYWLESYRAYRGQYSPDELAKLQAAEERNPGACKAYIKITKTKVLAAYGQILEILFGADKFPISVEATPEPEGIAKLAYIDPKGQPEATPDMGQGYGYPGDGNDLKPGATHQSILGGLQEKFKSLLGSASVKEGPSPDKTQLIQLSPAEETARRMDSVMQDQLTEEHAEEAIKKMAWEMACLGTGILKGPFNIEHDIPNWVPKDGYEGFELAYEPKRKLKPRFDFVSCWNFYPDPDASSLMDAEYIIERHLLSKNQLRKLKNLPKVDKDALEKAMVHGSSYTEEYWEQQLKDSNNRITPQRYEVLEYWGWLDTEKAKLIGLELDHDQEVLDVLQVNILVCNGQILRLVLNPYVPERIPYYAIPYEEVLYQIWGVGVPENMADSQELMNVHMRMSIDNLKLAGSVMFEVNEATLAPGQDMSIYPGKVWRKLGGAPGQSVFGFNVPNTAPAHIQMFDKVRQLADEQTGIPSYSHGQTGISGTTRTAGGMSMLMGASALNIKTVVKNIDFYLLKPMGEALFQWNMQFNTEDMDIRGDLRINAKGTSSLMQKEVVTQRLLSLIQVASNPIMAPFLNAEEVFRQIAINLDLDPDKVVNDPKTAALYAMMAGSFNNGPQQTGGGTTTAPTSAGSSEGSSSATGGINPSDPTGSGGGNIGFGASPMPGEAGAPT